MFLLARALIALAVVVAIGFGGLAALAWRSAIAPIAPPASSAFTPETVARGALLASAGRGGRLRRDSVSVPLSGSSAGWVHHVSLPGPHAGRA